MAEDFSEDTADAPRPAGNTNPAALDAALNGPASSTEEARAFLREQWHLTALQAKILHQEHALELSHLKWRRLNDQMKGALQILFVVAGIAIVAAVGAALWTARQADGIVVESFSVPVAFVEPGLTGEVLAGDITDRLTQMRRYLNANSIATTSDIRSDSKDDIHIEIPETGISLSEFWRHLRDWLGNERHVRGSVREIGQGQFVLMVTLTGSDPVTVTGASAHPDETIQKASEGLFSRISPSSYVAYLAAKGRYAEALAAVQMATDKGEAVRFGLTGLVWPSVTGDFEKGEDYERLAIALAPGIQIFRRDLAYYEKVLGHTENEYLVERSIVPLRESDQLPVGETHAAFEALKRAAERNAALLSGNYDDPAIVECFRTWAGNACATGTNFAFRSKVAGLLHDSLQSARLLGFAHQAEDADVEDIANAAWFAAIANADWRGAELAAAQLQKAILADAAGCPPRYGKTIAATQAIPLLAVAEAHLGAVAAARAAIGATPADCYPCARSRGIIEAVAGNRRAAERWFADAVRQAPSIPFAYTDWGEMLLRQGSYVGAIAKFKAAHEKSPHFADSLEMWGEALMQQNRSDLALAKFEDANRYAPNWGRLHFEWGKALSYADKKDQSKAQFAIAATLGLSASEKADLARWMSRHG